MLNNNYFGMEGIQEKGVWLKRKQVQKRVQRHCPVPRLLQILIKGGDDILPNWPFVLLLLVVLTKLWVLIRHTNMLRRLRKQQQHLQAACVNIYMQELKWKGIGAYFTPIGCLFFPLCRHQRYIFHGQSWVLQALARRLVLAHNSAPWYSATFHPIQNTCCFRILAC